MFAGSQPPWRTQTDADADEFIRQCRLDAASTTFLTGLPENVKDEVIASTEPRWRKDGLDWEDLFSLTRDVWLRQLRIAKNTRVASLVNSAPQEALRTVIMKFDPTRTKDGDVAARLESFLRSVIRTSKTDLGTSYTAIVPDCAIPERDCGRILGEKGSTVKQIVQAVCDCLKHNPREHGHVPIVQLSISSNQVRFELTLYPPFNSSESFETAAYAVREMVSSIIDDPTLYCSETENCKMPNRLQMDDWECPNKKCKNVCFAKRKTCLRCGSEKPKDWTPAYLARKRGPFQIGDVAWGGQKRIRVESMREWLGRNVIPPGECRVVWLVPVENRGYVIGSQGNVVAHIKKTSGLQSLSLSSNEEAEDYFGQSYVHAFLTGPPECTRTALRMVGDAAGGGRLAEDGFEQLLSIIKGAASRMQAGNGVALLRELTSLPDVRQAMAATKLLRRGARLLTLLEFLKQWPEYFTVKETGPCGAQVSLAKDQVDDDDDW